MSTSPQRTPSLLRLAQIGALALCAGMLWAGPGSAQTECWKNTVPLCDLVTQYSIFSSGGTCPGYYEVSFTFKQGYSPTCGSAIADLWSVSGGTGMDESFNNIVKIIPNDPCQRLPLTAYIKVKSYDAGAPSRTGKGPSPYVIDPTQFNQNALALRCDPCQLQADGTNPSCVPG
jgi:hypothetical protein